MKNFKKFLLKLEKQKVITRKPKPVYGFLLALIYLIILILVIKTDPSVYLINFTKIMAIFAIVFAIGHWVVVRILES